MRCKVRILLFALLVVIGSIYAEATPFSLIVPQTITMNTSEAGTGVSGGAFAGWLGATTTPIDFGPVQSTSIAPGTYLASAVSNNSDISASNLLLVWPTAIPLMPGQFVTQGSAGTAGLELFEAQVLSSEEIVSFSDVGLQYLSSYFWPGQHYTGTATLDFTFAINQDVAQYSIFVTFADLPNVPSRVVITSAQRVTSVFDPDFSPPPNVPVPEAASLLFIGTGLVGVAAIEYKRRYWMSVSTNSR